jgi:hypothetical protein
MVVVAREPQPGVERLIILERISALEDRLARLEHASGLSPRREV